MATKAGDDADTDKGKQGAEDKGDAGKSGAGDKGDTGKDAGGKKPGTDGGEKTYTQAELDAALAEDRKERRRAAQAKQSKSKASGKKGDDDDEESEELVKERQKRAQLEEKLRIRDAQDSVVAAAKTAGFSNPEKIYRLVKDDLEFDDGGKPENVKDLIALAKRDFPEELSAAKGKGSADGGEGGGDKVTGANSSMNDFIRRAAGRT